MSVCMQGRGAHLEPFGKGRRGERVHARQRGASRAARAHLLLGRRQSTPPRCEDRLLGAHLMEKAIKGHQWSSVVIAFLELT